MKYLLTAVFAAILGLLLGGTVSSILNQPSEHASLHTEKSTSPVIPLLTPETDHTNRSDPAQMGYQDIFEFSSVFEQLYASYQLANQASIKELKDYTRIALTSSDPLERFNLAAIFIERFVQLDPEEALQFIYQNPIADQQYFISHVYTSWARNDAQRALAHPGASTATSALTTQHTSSSAG